MAKKPTPSPAPSESELAEAVNRLADTVSVLTDIMSHVRSEISWIINNRAEFLLPTLPIGTQAQEHRSTIINPEAIACSDCEAASPPSLAAALQEGWTELAPHEGESWNYIGLCPACLASEYASETPTRKATAADRIADDTMESEQPKDTLF